MPGSSEIGVHQFSSAVNRLFESFGGDCIHLNEPLIHTDERGCFDVLPELCPRLFWRCPTP